jgi:hypothetical protein
MKSLQPAGNADAPVLPDNNNLLLYSKWINTHLFKCTYITAIQLLAAIHRHYES